MKLPYQSSVVLIPLLFKSENFEELDDLLLQRSIPLETIVSCQSSMKKELFIELLRYYNSMFAPYENSQRTLTTEHGRAIFNISNEGVYVHSIRIKEEFLGMGHSKELMSLIMWELHKISGLHLLECSEKLVPFYKKYDWKIMNTYGKNVYVMSFIS